jgi:prepilin-type N-terminal cleavage/methylation domain-containing protein
MQRFREAGFTLVELLVCVAIVGLLAALGIPKVSGAIMTSRQAQVQADLKLIHTALTQHFLDRGYYPNKLNNLKNEGYLPSRMSFASPVSGHWYFYAVDDNTSSRAPRAFVLGAPPQNAVSHPQLHHRGPLPMGTPPHLVANSWGPGAVLLLYEDDDVTKLNNIPTDLSDYRDNCKPASTTLCDLWTN